MVAVFRQFDCVLAKIVLQVAHLQRKGKFFDLVARVVNIEFAADLIARIVEHSGEAVAQCAAAGVAHVHRPGRIGRDKFHHHAFALAEIGAAVSLAAIADILQDRGIIAVVQKEVEKARTCDFAAAEKGIRKIDVPGDFFCNFARRHAEGFGTGHSGVGRIVAVGPVSRHLHSECRGGLRRQGSVRHRLPHCVEHRLAQSIFRFLYEF